MMKTEAIRKQGHQVIVAQVSPKLLKKLPVIFFFHRFDFDVFADDSVFIHDHRARDSSGMSLEVYLDILIFVAPAELGVVFASEGCLVLIIQVDVLFLQVF